MLKLNANLKEKNVRFSLEWSKPIIGCEYIHKTYWSCIHFITIEVGPKLKGGDLSMILIG